MRHEAEQSWIAVGEERVGVERDHARQKVWKCEEARLVRLFFGEKVE